MSESSFNLKRSVLVCLTASLFSCYQFLLQGAPAVMVMELADSFRLSMTDVGFLSSSFLYTYLLCQLPGGYIADKSNLRWLLVACTLLLALACYVFSVAESLWGVTTASVLMGVATGPAIAISMTLVARWFPDTWFPALAGFVETMALFGGALGPVIIPELMDWAGWRSAMACLAVVGVVLAVITVLIVRSHPKGMHHRLFTTDPEALSPQKERPFLQLIRKRDFWLCSVYGFGMFSVMVCFGCLWGVPFLCERFPEHHHHAAQSISVLFIGAAIGAPLIGFLASLTGRDRLIMLLSAVSCLSLTAWAVYGECSLTTMVVLCFFIGFTSAGYMLAFAIVKRVCHPRCQGLAIAAVNGMIMLGGPVMQPLVGSLIGSCPTDISVLDNYTFALTPILISQLLALCSLFFLSRKATDSLPFC